MDNKAEKLKEKIQKLNRQLKNIEEKHERSIAKLVKDTSKKDVDIKVLAGMIINAEKIINQNPGEAEMWQQAGEKFLFGSKRKSADPKNKADNK
jgi:hypothetical protein